MMRLVPKFGRLTTPSCCACHPSLKRRGGTKPSPPSMRSRLSSSHCGVRSSCQSQLIRLPHARLGGSVGYVGPLARSTFYPCRHLGRTPYASCAVERVAANPLHRAPHLSKR